MSESQLALRCMFGLRSGEVTELPLQYDDGVLVQLVYSRRKDTLSLRQQTDENSQFSDIIATLGELVNAACCLDGAKRERHLQTSPPHFISSPSLPFHPQCSVSCTFTCFAANGTSRRSRAHSRDLRRLRSGSSASPLHLLSSIGG
jgi:hypothetical protein